MIVELHNAINSITLLETIAVIAGLLYLILAVYESLWCWLFSLISVSLYFYIFIDAELWAEVLLQIYYLGTTGYGFYKWRYGGVSKKAGKGSPIMIASWNNHFIFSGIILVGTIGGGYVLSEFTAEKLPYLDAFTTIGALVTTWMVTQKYIENWIYWVVVDTAGVVLMYKSGLFLTALLFVVYLVIVIFGFINWRNLYREQQAAKNFDNRGGIHG